MSTVMRTGVDEPGGPPPGLRDFAEDWAGDEFGASVVDSLRELVGSVGVDGGAIDEQLTLDIRRFQGGVDSLGDGLVIAYAGEDDVCCCNCIFDGLHDLRLAWWQGFGEFLTSCSCSVVDCKWRCEVTLLNKVLHHATSHVTQPNPGKAGLLFL